MSLRLINVQMDYPARGDKRAQRAADQVLRLAARTRALYADSGDVMRVEPLEALDVQVLVALWKRPATSVSDVSNTLGVRRQTVSKSLRRLRDQRLIADAPADEDRREHRHTLTRRGTSAVRRFLDFAIEQLAEGI